MPKDNAGLVAAAAIGLLVWMGTREKTSGAGDDDTIPDGGGVAIGRVRDLSLGTRGAAVAGAKIIKSPGGILSVVSITFQYQGPKDTASVWFASKPRNCPGIGCDFNHGDNIPRFAWGFASVPLPESRDWQTITKQAAGHVMQLTVPQLGENLAIGGHDVEVGDGGQDLWAGVASDNAFDGNVFHESIQLAGINLIQDAYTLLVPIPRPTASGLLLVLS